MSYPLMGIAGWGLLALAFYIPAVDIWRAWRDRPMIVWDEYHGRWRAARAIQRERGR